MADINQILTLIAQSLLVIGIPILIAYGAQWVRLQAKELQSKLTADQQALIRSAIQMAVRAAEQAGVTGGGAAKKSYAVNAARAYMGKLGIDLDVDLLGTLIEAEVKAQFNGSTPPPDTAEARAALIDRAVDSAILAAQQSGLSGIIRDSGAEKKAYAAQVAAKYLSEHGVKVDPSLIAPLIEAALMKLKLESITRSGG